MPEPWLAFTQPVVRDLAWLIGSPPLLMPSASPLQANRPPVHWPNTAYFHELLAETTPLLQALDADPAALIAHSNQGRDFRLGVYVERLLGFWLAHPDNPRYCLIAANVPVRDNGITLGELDYLVRDKRHHRLAHWELAVKFYLGRPEAHPDQQWLGPGLHDRLDIKRDHLLQHQLELSQQPIAQAAIEAALMASGHDDLIGHAIERVCWLKGRLFFAADAQWAVAPPTQANPHALRGHWRIAADQTSNAYHAISTPAGASTDHPRLRGERLYQTQWSVTADWPDTPYRPGR